MLIDDTDMILRSVAYLFSEFHKNFSIKIHKKFIHPKSSIFPKFQNFQTISKNPFDFHSFKSTSKLPSNLYLHPLTSIFIIHMLWIFFLSSLFYPVVSSWRINCFLDECDTDLTKLLLGEGAGIKNTFSCVKQKVKFFSLSVISRVCALQQMKTKKQKQKLEWKWKDCKMKCITTIKCFFFRKNGCILCFYKWRR